jgi:hypothetical protein
MVVLVAANFGIDVPRGEFFRSVSRLLAGLFGRRGNGCDRGRGVGLPQCLHLCGKRFNRFLEGCDTALSFCKLSFQVCDALVPILSIRQSWNDAREA